MVFQKNIKKVKYLSHSNRDFCFSFTFQQRLETRPSRKKKPKRIWPFVTEATQCLRFLHTLHCNRKTQITSDADKTDDLGKTQPPASASATATTSVHKPIIQFSLNRMIREKCQSTFWLPQRNGTSSSADASCEGKWNDRQWMHLEKWRETFQVLKANRIKTFNYFPRKLFIQLMKLRLPGTDTNLNYNFNCSHSVIQFSFAVITHVTLIILFFCHSWL